MYHKSILQERDAILSIVVNHDPELFMKKKISDSDDFFHLIFIYDGIKYKRNVCIELFHDFGCEEISDDLGMQYEELEIQILRKCIKDYYIPKDQEYSSERYLKAIETLNSGIINDEVMYLFEVQSLEVALMMNNIPNDSKEAMTFREIIGDLNNLHCYLSAHNINKKG